MNICQRHERLKQPQRWKHPVEQVIRDTKSLSVVSHSPVFSLRASPPFLQSNGQDPKDPRPRSPVGELRFAPPPPSNTQTPSGIHKVSGNRTRCKTLLVTQQRPKILGLLGMEGGGKILLSRCHWTANPITPPQYCQWPSTMGIVVPKLWVPPRCPSLPASA